MARLVRILFVCHGNICRSPMAQYIMQDMVDRRGLSESFVIDSAATSTEELGNAVYQPARRELERQGVPCGDHRARQISKREVSGWDMIICMDDQNIRNARRRLGDGVQLYKMLEFAGEDRSVADPWYTGDFQTTYDDIVAGCTGLLSYLGY